MRVMGLEGVVGGRGGANLKFSGVGAIILALLRVKVFPLHAAWGHRFHYRAFAYVGLVFRPT
jgi:hypothetical protein